VPLSDSEIRFRPGKAHQAPILSHAGPMPWCLSGAANVLRIPDLATRLSRPFLRNEKTVKTIKNESPRGDGKMSDKKQLPVSSTPKVWEPVPNVEKTGFASKFKASEPRRRSSLPETAFANNIMVSEMEPLHRNMERKRDPACFLLSTPRKNHENRRSSS
jgi:hypothetical protein